MVVATLLQQRGWIQLEFLCVGLCGKVVHALDLKWLIVETVFDGMHLAEKVFIAAIGLHDCGEVVCTQTI